MTPDPHTKVTPDAQMDRIFEWRLGFNAVYLLDLGLRLGLFRALADAPGSSPQQLAERLGLQPHHVDVWCKTAYGLELLDADENNGYRLAPYYDQILANPGHPRYLGGLIQLATDVATEDFRRAPEVFRTGEPMPFQGRGEDFARLVGEATLGLQVLTVKRIVPGLAGLIERLEAGGTILEVGCGTGNLLLQLANAFPKARCIGVEIDVDSAAQAQHRIAQAGLSDRVAVRQADVAAAVSPESVDLCLMIQVLHEIAPGIRPHVVTECGRALTPGGWMAIIDETYPSTLEEMRLPEFRYPLQTGFEELTWGNVIPTREEQERLLRDAGLSGPIRRELVSKGFTVLTAQR